MIIIYKPSDRCDVWLSIVFSYASAHGNCDRPIIMAHSIIYHPHINVMLQL